MAVQSRPTLRSSSRRNVGAKEDTEVPPPSIQPNPLNTLRGKRKRDHGLGSESDTSIKKQKPSPPKKADQSIGLSKDRALKSLPLRDKPDGATQDAVTSRPPDHPLQYINGFTTTTSTSHNAQTTIKANNLTINTTHAPNKAEKRSLRSHDGGSRSKSELALYFPNYDELVSIEPKEPEFLTPESILYITDEPSKSQLITSSSSSSHNHSTTKFRTSSNPYPTTTNGSSYTPNLSEATFTSLNDATRLDLSSLDKSTRHQKDPLPDALYLKPHRRAERQEKQLRNIEKERAMHERVQLERLMDGLRAHDWLRVMGISGITDSEKKAYEPKRDYFIQEVRVLLKKFQEWKEEEKRRKVEKEESMLHEDEEAEEDSEEEASVESDGDPPGYIDDDASVARQLHHEAVATTKPGSSWPSHHKKHSATTAKSPIQKPFTSFYSKPYLREAAIGKHRRGRARYAFGQPLPEPPDRAFELGADILTPDALAAQERKRRVAKRQAK